MYVCVCVCETADQFLKPLYIAGFMAGHSTTLKVISTVQETHSLKLSFRTVTNTNYRQVSFYAISFCMFSLERNLTIDTTF